MDSTANAFDKQPNACFARATGSQLTDPYLDGFRLLITFNNDEKRIFDVEPYLDRSPLTRPLCSVDYFHQAFCSDGTIE